MNTRRLVLALASLVAVSLLAFVPAATASPGYSFNLFVPNTAENPTTGDVIRVTGAGVFDPVAGTVSGKGSFTHRDSTGRLVARGVWVATGFTAFESFGGPSNGQQGGVLTITATLFATNGTVVPDVTIEITCLVNTPGGFEEGTTVGDFSMKTGGFTLFHLSA